MSEKRRATQAAWKATIRELTNERDDARDELTEANDLLLLIRGLIQMRGAFDSPNEILDRIGDVIEVHLFEGAEDAVD